MSSLISQHSTDILENSVESMKMVRRKDVIEIASMNSPPEMLVHSIFAIYQLFHQDLGANHFSKIVEYNDTQEMWRLCRPLVKNPDLIKYMLEYRKDHVEPLVVQRASMILNHPRFREFEPQKVSLALSSMLNWVKAIIAYHEAVHGSEASNSPGKQHMSLDESDLMDDVLECPERMNGVNEDLKAIRHGDVIDISKQRMPQHYIIRSLFAAYVIVNPPRKNSRLAIKHDDLDYMWECV